MAVLRAAAAPGTLRPVSGACWRDFIWQNRTLFINAPFFYIDKIPNLDVPKHLKAKYQAGWTGMHIQKVWASCLSLYITQMVQRDKCYILSLSYKKHETCETRVSTKKTSYNKCSWWLAAKLLQSKLLAKAWPCSSSCGAGPSKNGANSVLKSHHFWGWTTLPYSINMMLIHTLFITV